MNGADHAPGSYLLDRPVLTARQRRTIRLLIPPLLGALCAVPVLIGEPDALERVTIDWRFRCRGPLQPDPRIVLVHINESSRRALTHPDERFDFRDHLDDAIDQLADAGAVAIGLDFWLQGRGDPQIDRRLADAIAGTNVVLGVAVADDVSMRAPPVFLEAEPDEGSLVVQPDPDGVLRRLPELPNLDLLVGEDGSTIRIPHFPFVLTYLLLAEEAMQAGRPMPALELPATGAAHLGDRVVRYGQLVNYAAGPGEGFVTYDFADVVREQCDLGPVDGAVVLIGEARSLEDHFAVPFTDRHIPGVYYHANVIDMILHDRPLADWSSHRRWVALLVVLVASAVGWYFLSLRDWWAGRYGWVRLGAYFIAGIVLFAGGWLLVCRISFQRATVLPMVPLLATIGVMTLVSLGVQLVVALTSARRLSQRNRQIESLFGRSVSAHVLAAIKSDPTRVARTEVRQVSVLFCDVRGFTATSTHMAPEAVAAMLNEYFDAITSAVFDCDGFIDKFVGDELMAVFGAPLTQEDHAIRAADAAMGVKRALKDLNARRAARGQAPIDCGIGIHCGPAAAGHIGTARRANYTVVGDTVNMAARIEEFTKRGEILVSESVAQALPASFNTRRWQTVTIRGIDQPQQLYELSADAAPAGAGCDA